MRLFRPIKNESNLHTILLHKKFSHAVSLFNCFGSLCCACRDGELYKINLYSKKAKLVAKLGSNVNWVDHDQARGLMLVYRDCHEDAISVEIYNTVSMKMVMSFQVPVYERAYIGLVRGVVYFQIPDGILVVSYSEGIEKKVIYRDYLDIIGLDLESECPILKCYDTGFVGLVVVDQRNVGTQLLTTDFLDVCAALSYRNRIIFATRSATVSCWDRNNKMIRWERSVLGRQLFVDLVVEKNILGIVGPQKISFLDIETSTLLVDKLVRPYNPKCVELCPDGNLAFIDGQNPYVYFFKPDVDMR